MKTRFPIFLLGLLALAAPTVGVSAPGDGPRMGRPGAHGPRMERRGERREQRDVREQRFLEALSLTRPELHTKVMEIRTDRPLMYRQLLRQAGQDLRIRTQDPNAWGRVEKMIELTHALKGHLDAWEAANERERRKLRVTIEADIAELFEVRQAHRRAQLALLEQRMERLRGDIAERDTQKDAIVSEFTDRMLRGL